MILRAAQPAPEATLGFAMRRPTTTPEQANYSEPVIMNPDPERVRRIFAEFRQAVAIDARERRYADPEPPSAETVGRI